MRPCPKNGSCGTAEAFCQFFSRNVSLGGFPVLLVHISQLRYGFCSSCIDGCFQLTIPISLQLR
ncbi:amidophosphoribosyl transferase, partial [Salmonella enterica subsp. enterica serovar Agona]